MSSCITGNIFRPNEKTLRPCQDGNILWFNEIFKYFNRKDYDKHEVVLSDMSIYNNDISIDKWIYYCNNLTDEVYHFYNDKYCKYDKIYGFEMPNSLIEWCKKEEKIFYNFLLSPIRFDDDLHFMLKTNNNEKIFTLNLNNLKYRTYKKKAKLYKTVQPISLKQNSCMFAGQTNVDLSLYKEGRILSLFDFKDNFENIAREYNMVYYKIHPLMQKNDKLINYLNSIKNVEIIDNNVNSYWLLNRPEIKKLYTITSSMAFEAEYFDKPSKMLSDYPFKEYTWIDTEYHFCLKSGELRSSINMDWGYDIFK